MPPTTSPSDQTVDLQLRGMTCAGCVARVDAGLRQVSGVADVDVNLVNQSARVRLADPDTAVADLVAAVKASGYEVIGTSTTAAQRRATSDAAAADEAAERARLRRDAAVAGALTAPLLVLAMSHGAIPGSDGPVGHWLQFALATLVVFGPGRRFLRLALSALRHRTTDMNTLVSLGALAAWGQSTATLLAATFASHVAHGEVHLYFEAAATILTFVTFGKLLELRARHHLGDAVRSLHALVPAKAVRVGSNGEETVEIASLQIGDRVVVRPGERVPADGEVTEGNSAIDESMLTGESLPIDKAPGDAVFGGTLNREGRLVVRVTRQGEESALGRIAAAVEAAQATRAPIAQLADRVSAVFVPAVLAIALLTFVVWWSITPGDAAVGTAVERMVAVLVIACPCALGLATPAAVAVGVGRGAELGILWKGGAAIEAASHLDTVFVDKTGTVTRGEPELVAAEDLQGTASDEVLQRAAAVEAGSEHPLAAALVAAAKARGLALAASDAFRALPGVGVEARIDGHTVRVVKQAAVPQDRLPQQANARAEELAARGCTISFVLVDGRPVGLVALADRPADGAAATVATLQAAGLEVVMLTGDRRSTAAAIAREVGIDRVEAELTPTDKAARIEAARSGGRRVAMVGDGVNDAPGLAAADVGIAVSRGTDSAAAAADVVLLRGSLDAVPLALELARATLHTIHRNLWAASIYNVLGIPVAAGVFAFAGLQLSPVFASLAMSLSSVSVLASSLWLRRFHRGGKLVASHA
ncbi:MAG: copper-translocating P-type ATPase [Planctomycetes bacterium]|nr:copper-translocating P-type ATPase [Planctomycetota bacterium]